MTLPRTGAGEWAASQASPWDTVNLLARMLDAGACRFLIEDRDLAAPPGSCADGACYLVAASPTGAWSGKAGKLAVAIGTNASNGWQFITVAVEGVDLYVRDENLTIEFNGTSWITLSTSGGLVAANNLSDVANPVTAGANIRPVESLVIACSDETTNLTAGTAKVTLRMPYAFTLTAVRASVTTAPTGSVLTVDINEGGASILSTKLTIDASEKTSTTAATPAVISDSTLADDAEITIDIDGVGSTVAGAGLKVYLIGHRT